MVKRRTSRKKKRPAKKGIRRTARRTKGYSFSVSAAERTKLNNRLLTLKKNLEKAIDSFESAMIVLMKL